MPPIYEYQCECGEQFDEFKTVSQYTENPKSEPCEACGSTNTQRVISASTVIEDIQPYRSTITGERIRGRSHHRSHLKQHGYEELGTDSFDEAKKDFQRPPKDDKQDRINDAVLAYDHLAK